MRLLVLVLALAAGCRNPFPLDGRPCPCIAGYTCDTSQQVCVRDGGHPDGAPPDGPVPDGALRDGPCSLATEALDCGPHQACDATGGALRCACVAGYTDSGQGCVWTGTVRDPAISELATWSTARGALLNPTAAGGIDPGEASFTPAALCTVGSIRQTFEMPTLERAEPLVLELSYKDMYDFLGQEQGHALMGVSWGRGWVPLEFFFDARFHTTRICLGESAYAPAGTPGRGKPVTLSLGPYEQATDCPGTGVTNFAIDHAQIVTANPGECGTRFGEGVNSGAETTGGWTFVGPNGGFVPGIGVGGSRAARVLSSCGVQVRMTHPLDIVASNPALELFLGVTGGAASTIAEVRVALLTPILAPPVGQTAAMHVCLPPSLAGQSTTISFSVLANAISDCAQIPDSSLLADDVHVVEDAACQPNDAAGNPGFEEPGVVFGARTADQVGDGIVRSAAVIRNTPGIAHSGTGYFALESYGNFSSSTLTLAPIVPAPQGSAGPALTLFSDIENAPDTTTDVITPRTAVRLEKAAGWIKNTICLDPALVGRPEQVLISHYGGTPASSPSGPASGYGTQAALIDDLEVTTDPSCPAQ